MSPHRLRRRHGQQPSLCVAAIRTAWRASHPVEAAPARRPAKFIRQAGAGRLSMCMATPIALGACSAMAYRECIEAPPTARLELPERRCTPNQFSFPWPRPTRSVIGCARCTARRVIFTWPLLPSENTFRICRRISRNIPPTVRFPRAALRQTGVEGTQRCVVAGSPDKVRRSKQGQSFAITKRHQKTEHRHTGSQTRLVILECRVIKCHW